MQEVKHRCALRTQRVGGFSLLELMLALLVAAILAAVAYPSYRDQVRKGRRSDAIAALGTLQLAQERHRSSNPSYAATLAELGRPAVSEGGLYDLSIRNASSSGYELVATPRAGSSQATDSSCAQMAIGLSAGATQYLAAASGGTLAADTARRCWPQ